MPATTSSITKQATDLRAQVVPANSVRPTPVVTAAAKLGYSVSEFTPTERTKKISGAVDHENQTIFVNANDGADRKRFTIAHDIAHIALHGKEESVVDYRHQMEYGSADLPKEREANQFAADLLMPRNVFEALWYAYGEDVGSVAEQLQVSKAAAKVRADELRLL